MSDAGIAELADSISKVGLLQPIIVRPLGEGYQIVAGERLYSLPQLGVHALDLSREIVGRDERA